MNNQELLAVEKTLSALNLSDTDEKTAYSMFKNLLAVRKKSQALREAVNEMLQAHKVKQENGAVDITTKEGKAFMESYRKLMAEDAGFSPEKVDPEAAYGICRSAKMGMGESADFCEIFA